MKTDRFIVLGDVVINMDSLVMMGPHGREKLTPKEGAVLQFLYDRRGLAVPRADLAEQVWGYDGKAKSRTVDITLGRLRRKLQPDPEGVPLITSIYGYGYRLEGLASETAESFDASPVEVAGRNRPWHGDPVDMEAAMAIAASCRRLQLVGAAGSGKSRFAYELTKRLEWRPLWISFDPRRSQTGEEIASQILTPLKDTFTSGSTMVEAVTALPSDMVVVLDGLGPLEAPATLLLELLFGTEGGPAILTTSRQDARYRSAKTLEVPRLRRESARALFLEELGYHRPTLEVEDRKVVDPWLLAADLVPGGLIHAAQNIDSAFQLAAGPSTVDFAPFDDQVLSVLEESPALLEVACELSRFPDGLLWKQAKSLWPDALPELAQLLHAGLVLQLPDGRIQTSQRTFRALIGQAHCSATLQRWAQTVEDDDLVHQRRNMHAALDTETDFDLRVKVLSKLTAHLVRFGELRAGLEFLNRELASPCTYAPYCAQVHLLRAHVHQLLGQFARALGDFRAALRYLANIGDPHRVQARLGIAVALSTSPDVKAGVRTELESLDWRDLPHPTRAIAANSTALVHLNLGEAAACHQVCEAALMGMLGQPYTPERGWLELTRSTALSALGQPEAAEASFANTASIARESGQIFQAGLADLGRGAALMEQNRIDLAVEILARAAASLQKSEVHLGLALCNHGLALLATGEIATALTVLERALLHGERTGSARVATTSIAMLGLGLHLLGRAHAALDHYERAIHSLKRPQGQTHFVLAVFAALARFHVGQPFELPPPIDTETMRELHEVITRLTSGQTPAPPKRLYGRLAVATSNQLTQVRTQSPRRT